MGTPWGSLGSLGSMSLGLSGVTQIRPGDRWVHPGLLGSSGVVGFTRERPGVFEFMQGRWFHPGSSGSLGCALGVHPV